MAVVNLDLVLGHIPDLLIDTGRLLALVISKGSIQLLFMHSLGSRAIK